MYQFIYSPLEGHLGCFQSCTIINKDAINVHVQVLVWTCFQLLQVNIKEWDCWVLW